jgi:hypothetical protein
MRRIPEWLEQIADGLRDGTDWFVREIRTPPTPVRVIGWLGFQALLFKLQPQLWHLLIEVVQFVASVSAMELHVQLLLVVITILVGQTLLVENRFKLVRKIVENMDNSAPEAGTVASDGGTNVEIETRTGDRRRWWICVVCGAITGGEIGLFWGPAGVIGLAVLGAMLGDEWVRRTRDEYRS